MEYFLTLIDDFYEFSVLISYYCHLLKQEKNVFFLKNLLLLKLKNTNLTEFYASTFVT